MLDSHRKKQIQSIITNIDINKLDALRKTWINFVESPSLPNWHKSNEENNKSALAHSNFFFGGTKSLNQKEVPLYLIERGSIQIRDITASLIHKSLKKNKRYHYREKQNASKLVELRTKAR